MNEGMEISDPISSIASTAFDQTMSNVWNWAEMKKHRETTKYNKWLNKNKYQIAVKDLRKSGINPLLAVGGSVGGGMQSASSGGSVHGSRGSAPSGFASASQAQTARRLADSQIELNDASAKLAGEKEFTEAELQHEIHARAEKTRKEAQVVQQQIDANLSSAQSKKISQETLQLLYNNYKRKAQGEIYQGRKGHVMSMTEWLAKLMPFSGAGQLME